MPADYLAVRDSCIKNKESKSGKPATEKQIRDCKRMAAIWWVKKHGKPFPKHENAELHSYDIYDISIAYSDDILRKSIDEILVDNQMVLGSTDSGEITITFLNSDEIINDEFYFTQPFEKYEVNYRRSDNNDVCANCVHNISQTRYITDYDTSFCHLVQGLINTYFICDYFADSIIQQNIKDQK